MMRKAVVGVCLNPLVGLRSHEMMEIEPGATLNEIMPVGVRDLLVCQLNGGPDFVHRDDWATYQIQPGDLVTFTAYPQDRDTLRSLLEIALVVLSFYTGSPLYAVLGAVAVNALLPPTAPQQVAGESQSPTYTTSLSGNQARPDAPIPRACGRIRVVPPFAAQPYVDFDNATNDQYYYALFPLTIGDCDLEQALIDDTTLDSAHFRDVLTARVVQPGFPPITVSANMVTAPEVSQLDMKTGRYLGGFAACAPKQTALAIFIDIVTPKGLGQGEGDGSISSRSIVWRVEIREVGEFSEALSAWTLMATETLTAATVQVQRRTYKYTLGSILAISSLMAARTSIRCEIRLVRTDARADDVRALHDAGWVGLRAELGAAAPLNPNVTHYEVKMRASEQLSQLSQRSLSFILQAKVRTLDSTLAWQPEVHTRNPAWWLLEVATSGLWGLNYSTDRIDLQSFYDYSVVWDERQDRFDFNFDTTMDGWEALQMIARCGRARVFRRYGILTIARDELATLPVTAFTARNTTPGSMSVTETVTTSVTPDGVILEYFDNRAWSWRPINCPCPGVGTMTKPVRMRLQGITGAKHAEREGRYEAARMLYRRRTTTCTTEMQGLLPTYMAPVRWMPQILGYGQTGDVIAWDEPTLTLTLSERLVFPADGGYITLMRDDGSLTEVVPVTVGAEPNIVVLPYAPDFVLTTDDARRERPRFLFGPVEGGDELVRVSAIADAGLNDEGAQLYEITAEVDDVRVHEADNALLPAPGEVQDPVVTLGGSSGGGGGGGSDTTFFIPQLSTHTAVFGDFATPSPVTASAIFTYTGVLQLIYTASPATHEWLLNGPTTSVQAAAFEIRATYLGTTDYFGQDTLSDSFLELQTGTAVMPTAGTVGAWESLGTTRTWSVTTASAYGAESNVREVCALLIEIREVASGTVQASAIIKIATEQFI